MKRELYVFWQARNEREKRVLLFCAGVLLFGFLYAYIWQPGEHAITRLHEILPELRANDARMHAQANEIWVLRKHVQISDKQVDIKSEIDASARHYQLHDHLVTLSVDSIGQVHLTLDAVSFNGWIVWLDALQHEDHLRLVASHLQVLGDQGLVKVDATLTDGNAE